MLKEFIDFFYSNHRIVWENIYVFIIWGLLCISLTYAITSRQNGKLKKEKEILAAEYNALKEKYSQLDENSRLIAGNNFSVTSAKAVSDKIRHKK